VLRKLYGDAMTYTEKGTVEDFIIQDLQKMRWTYSSPEEIRIKRKNIFEDPLVSEDLINNIKRLNNKYKITDSDLDFILISLRTIPANLEGIRRFLDILRNGLVIPLQKEGKERVIKLFDLENFDNNEFIVTNQFRVEGTKGNIRADVVLIVNGIPLVLIEAKNPTSEEADWTDAYEQIKRYEEEAPEIFKYVQFSIATDGIKTYYFPNSFAEEGKDLLSFWRDPYPNKGDFEDDSLKVTLYGLLLKSNILDLLENFVFIKKERDKTTKIMSRYMQFRASNKIFNRVINTLSKREKGKFGLIWHWQGSGKTYTMAFSAWKLLHSPKAERPSIFIMVDRKDLEEQIENDLSFIDIPIEKVNRISKLIEILRWGKEGKRGIFLITIEKFSPKEFLRLEKEGEKIEIKRENVIVLADEVHRTQYGKFSTLMRSIFKNAFIFGFTGTPLSKLERNTFQRFCPINEFYLDRYSMLDALKDGFTVSLAYQVKLPQYHLNKQQLEAFARYEEEELKTRSSEEQKELRKKVRVISAWLKKGDRIENIAKDITDHFKEIVEPTELKAMIVTVDREACVLYKNAIDKILPSSLSEIVMTYDPKVKDVVKDYFKKNQERWYKEQKIKDYKDINKKIIEYFKERKEPKILIVTDMLITGFDAPILWTMYLDKPLKEHRLLQAIARTNRPFGNKKFGLVNDYIGVLPELEKAFAQFEASDAKSLKIVIRGYEKEKEHFKQLLEDSSKFFEGIKREDTRESLRNMVQVLKLDPDKAKNFEKTLKELMKSYEMLRGDPFLKDYLLEYAWLIKVYIAYYKDVKKRYVNELEIEKLSKKTIQLIQQTVDVKDIDDTFPTVSIDETYIDFLKKKAPKTMGAAIDVLTTVQYEARVHPTSLFFININKEVERTYEQLRNKKIETEEAIKRLLDFSQRIVDWKAEEKEIGPSYPIYEAIKVVIPSMDKQRAIGIVNELVGNLKAKKLIFEGWQTQRDVRRKVKAEIRLHLLSKIKNNRDKMDELNDTVFDALEGIKWAK
jgi:type I restriction enzyme R subunit